MEKQQTRTVAHWEKMKPPVSCDSCMMNSNPAKTDGPSGYWYEAKEKSTQFPYF